MSSLVTVGVIVVTVEVVALVILDDVVAVVIIVTAVAKFAKVAILLVVLVVNLQLRTETVGLDTATVASVAPIIAIVIFVANYYESE